MSCVVDPRRLIRFRRLTGQASTWTPNSWFSSTLQSYLGKVGSVRRASSVSKLLAESSPKPTFRSAYGQTAVKLSGLFADVFLHLGALKALHLQSHCIPRVVCGSYFGSVSAALVSLRTDSELTGFFATGLDTSDIDGQRDRMSCLQNFMSGFRPEKSDFEQFLKANLPLCTFAVNIVFFLGGS